MPDKRSNKLKKKKGKGGNRILAPSTKDTPSSDLSCPVFSLEYLQKGYCVKDCNSKDKADFAVQLRQLSELNWRQLRAADRHGLGYEKISKKSIKPGTPPHITDDVTLIAFRFSGKKPMVGYRDGRTFYVVWLDRDFSLYDHGS